MLIDAAELPADHLLEADACVVGGGVAGLTVAAALARAGVHVCVLESGGRTPAPETRALDRGEVAGHAYYRLHRARTRALGGSSHQWLLDMGEGRRGARLRPLDPIDFERRDAVPHSGWPFGFEALEPYYRQAAELCGAGPWDGWDEPGSPPATAAPAGEAAPPAPPALLHEGAPSLRTAFYRFADRDVFVRGLADEVAAAHDARVVLHATLTGIATDADGRAVTEVTAVGPDRKPLRVRARRFVLAMGGIEIPRTLLLATDTHAAGLGNAHDLVGRHFMEHPHAWVGFYRPADPSWIRELAAYRVHAHEGAPRLGQLALTEDAMRREGLMSFSVHLVPGPRPAKIRPHLRRGALAATGLAVAAARLDGAAAARHARTLPAAARNLAVAAVRKPALLARLVAGRRIRAEGFRLNTMAEQAPNPDSRVTLSRGARDALGRPLPRLEWRLSGADLESMRRCHDILDRELRAAGHGGLERDAPPDVLPAEIHGGWHHMGTTRMHADPRRGVVDPDCRVHGVVNLYVAGPSVFPTGGCANPTLTIVALALRLADHLGR